MGNSNVTRYAPAGMALLAVLAALVGPWLILEFGDQSESYTLKRLIDEDVLVMRWFWVSTVGILVLLATAVMSGTTAKQMTQAGALLAVVLPVRTLFDVYTDAEEFAPADVSAGWPVWVFAVAAVLALIVSRFMPEDSKVGAQPLQRIERAEP